MTQSDVEVGDQLAQLPVVAISIPTSTADRSLSTRPGLLVGWSLRETTGGGAAVVEFEGSQDTAGPHVGEQALASGGTGSFQVAPDGAYCPAGLMLHVISGSVAGVAYYRH